MQRLLLASVGIGALPELIGGATDGMRVAFVPTPAGPDAMAQPWVQEDRRQLELLGLRISTLELATATPAEVAAHLAQVGLVHVTGGSAYLVLWHARRTGFAALVPRLVREGSLVYVGASAGAMLAGPDIEPAANPDGRAEAPPMTSTAAFGLVPFSVLPHDDDPQRQARNESIVSRHGPGGFVRLRDDQAVLVRGEAWEVVSSPLLGG
jgi:dipeptidase E